MTEPAPIVIDLNDVATRVRRRALAVLVGGVIGAIAAAGIIIFVPPRFDATAMMLIRTSTNDPMSMVKDRMGALSELLPGNLGGADEEELATELALLQSRAVLGTVVDSLRLEVVPRSPDRIPPSTIVDSLRFTERFKPEKVSLAAGANSIPQGKVWAKQKADVKLFDREDAIDELASRIVVRKTGGNAVEITYRGRDSITAAEVPNLLADIYMLRRKTVDRGLNQRRLEFLSAKADSVRSDLRRSADVVAAAAQANGSGASPDIAAKALADETGMLEAKMSELRAGEGALDSLIGAVQTKHVDPRNLAGFPDLLRSPALNDLIAEIAKVETDRTTLLATRPETSPQAIALAHARDSLAAQLLPIATAYRQSMVRQQTSIEHDLDGLRAQLSRLPKAAAAVAKEQAEVTRLAAMNAGMGAQVLTARLAALAEGGDVRVIDAAVAPRRVTFPRPLTTIVVCIAAGIAAGFIIALLGAASTPAVVTTYRGV
ncbi:MAG: Wzz/FepE/Etk N-terminal domain-containing protein [Gemmatimonadaceae bacterium]